MTKSWTVVESATAADGTVIDTETAERLARGFESDDRALDAAARVPGRAGRPSLSGDTGPTPKISARIPDDLRAELEAKVARENLTVAEAVRRAVRSWVDAG
jgi:hypothetical protein